MHERREPVVCRYYQEGDCRKGDRCKFAHTGKRNVKKKEDEKQSKCRFSFAGACFASKSCHTEHMQLSAHLQVSLDELEQLLRWNHARDVFLGLNYRVQDVQKGLELARECSHPEAVWLTKMFAQTPAPTKAEALKIILQGQDALALCFSSILSGGNYSSSLERASTMGCALAQGWLACRADTPNKFELAQRSAEQKEAGGIFLLGKCYSKGEGCKWNQNKAQEHILRAARMGHVAAMVDLAKLFARSSFQRFLWLGRAARCNNALPFVTELPLIGQGGPRVWYLVGCTLRGHIDQEGKRIFRGFKDVYGLARDYAVRAVEYYEFQASAQRAAIDACVIVGLRFGVPKDIRRKLSLLLWEWRFDIVYREPPGRMNLRERVGFTIHRSQPGDRK